ncbi:MAG TPA: kelch repeat-containing protein [Pilimelia sp.]|nr:kelch repeat-containing protein [Pilimelia sp.]
MRVRRASLVLIALLGAGGCTGPDPAEPDGRPASPAAPPAASPGLTWRALAPAPSARTEVAAAVAGTRAYVVGGFQGDGGTVATVEVYDTSTGRWERGPDLPVAVNHAMAATVGDTVYVFGGYLSGRDVSPAAYRLEPAGWRAVAPLPSGRAAGTAVAQAGKIYIAGGIAPGGLATQMLVYDPGSDTWATAPGPPTPREHLGGGGFDGRVYTVGGRTSAGNLDAFEVFDPGTGGWTALPPLPTRRGGLAAAVTCAGHLVAVGGEARATFPEAEAYDVRAGRWQSLPPLPTPRHGLGVVTLGTVLYTFAGGPRPGLFVADTAEAIDLAPLGACPTPG